MEMMIGQSVSRLIARAHDMHIPRGWVILMLALLAWGVFWLIWLGVSTVLWLSAPPSPPAV
jgi:hypothetical protein